MKPPYLLLGACLLALSSCKRYSDEPTAYYPVLMARDVLEKSITFHPAASIDHPSKTVYYNNYLLVLDLTKGIHIIDNSNLRAPVNRGYIGIPGCRGMAVKDNALYADNAVDLVILDLSNMANGSIAVTRRIKNTFPEMEAPDDKRSYGEFQEPNRPANTVIIRWEK